MKIIESAAIFILLLNGLFVSKILSQENLVVIVERCTGLCNKKFCTINVACRPLNATSKWNTLDIDFHEVIKAPVIIEIVAYKKFRTQFRPFMLKVEVDFCHEILLRNHPFLKLYGGGIADNGTTLFDPCPLKGRRHLNPWATSSKMFVLVPTGEWRLDFTLSKIFNDTKTHILSVAYYYTIKATTAEEF